MTPEIAVNTWARSVIGLPFAWGETDCGVLTLKALSQLTGTNWVTPFGGAWRDEREALAHFDQMTPSQVLQERGALEVPPSAVVFGDVITVPAPPWPEQCHFVFGRSCLVSDIKSGVRLLPSRLFTRLPGARVWRVAACLKPSQ